MANQIKYSNEIWSKLAHERGEEVQKEYGRGISSGMKKSFTAICIAIYFTSSIYYIRFGHEDAVLDIDSLYRECAVSCGGRDRSVRLWKIPEESQLLFQSTT